MFVHIYTSNMNKLYLSPFTKTDIIIVLVGLLLMTLLHILTQSCSGCYLFIFWHRLIISAMKVCYYQTVGEVASLPSCDHCTQGQIDFCGHFRVWDVTFFIFWQSYDIWYKCVLPADSVWYIITTFMWPLISSSNNSF
jgi:hypothetical protein